VATKVKLDQFDNSWFKPGKGVLVRSIWFLINQCFFNSYLFPFYSLKRILLRSFGAKVGVGVVVKPKVNIKYPWKLQIGEYTWIGEQVWIDNLDEVEIGSHVCISQGAMILSGNHNYKKAEFDLIVKPINIGDGAWLGAKSIVTQGVLVGEEAVLGVQSVASNELEARGIYRGNPAVKVGERVIG